ncbi:phenylacetic acid degradation protein [Defluviimonas sp. 20V17]|uniref:Phenylacetic acid degradation protein n=1 Tax=Allgaiera indica TaxID=765699 RepID=A0AAN4UNP7_9RHOB|nr:1,2-phenylacetyl-CoA epoxidase subunit PaaC [Allgaiera indica]KDB02173.1 phenylacetic acid degradation protein [Defluviimonas sp. 20V17]GHD98783.1 phenylacetic acid degradation protein [Allgaiera indica]SDW06262.1 ring-1,2-phenylacetyl-CoA epoxidase subunit PaaC [Allgaiera indica]
MSEAFVTALLELADDHLVLGHRLSEWCGHAPMLEEDLALPNMALDLIGAARGLYARAGEIEGKGRDEDDLAYLRGERAYLNCLLVERENGDFAQTMLRQLYFAAFMEPYWRAAASSDDPVLRGIAAKAVKEVAYHIRHAGEWVVRMGDGTGESARRMAEAVEELHRFTDELFFSSPAAEAAEAAGLLPVRAETRGAWEATIRTVFAEARLGWPAQVWAQQGGRAGAHGEALGHLLAEMQSLHRAHPGAAW